MPQTGLHADTIRLVAKLIGEGDSICYMARALEHFGVGNNTNKAA